MGPKSKTTAGKGGGKSGKGKPKTSVASSHEELDKLLIVGTDALADDYESPALKVKRYDGGQVKDYIDHFADEEGSWDDKLVIEADAEDVEPILKQNQVSSEKRSKKPTPKQKNVYEQALGKKNLPPLELYEATQDFDAGKYGFPNLYELLAVKLFLQQKGNLTLRPIFGDGNCLLKAVLDQIQFVSEEDQVLFEPIYLRRMALLHFLSNREKLFDAVASEIKYTYGLVEDQASGGPGPFSMREYLHYMSKDKVWCDGVMLLLLSSMWSVRITVVRSDCCKEMKFRHNGDLKTADFVLVYNCSWDRGHYSSVSGKEKVLARKVNKHSQLDADINNEEKEERELGTPDDEGFILVAKDKLKFLMQCDKKLHVIKRAMGGQFVSDVQVEAAGGGPSPKKYRPHEERKPQELELNKVHCDKCNIDFKAPGYLQKHLNKTHLMQFKFECKKCGRGLQMKEGLKSHMLKHENNPDKLHKCDQCETTFTTRKAKVKHEKEQHGPSPKLKCGHCDRTFHTKGGVKQHEAQCEGNDNKVNNVCSLCGQDGFWLIKKLNEHKRDVHHWII